jgi:hypothetical protein
MNRSELEQLLELADRRAAVHEQLERVRRLGAEVERDQAIERSVPELHASLEARAVAITPIARELERQWSAQGPLVALWTRAAEQLQLAESAGVDTEIYRDEVQACARRVESARLQTRDQRDLLEAERDSLIVTLGDLPVEVEPPVELRDDSRPEALRRDTLALIETIDEAKRALAEEHELARDRLTEARGALAALPAEAELEAELGSLNDRLPAAVELPANTPPSLEQRLRRAGIEVATGARE